MFHKTEIRRNLLGILEIALFMPQGAKRYTADKNAFKSSFLIPLAVLPLSLITLIAAHPESSLDTASLHVLTLIYALRLFISLGLFLAVVYCMADKMGKRDDFYRFAIANNWLALPPALIMLPLSLGFLNGVYSWDEIYPLMVVITLYSYACTAFMATHILRIPYELACFIAILGMAIHQTSLQALKAITAHSLMLMT
jgi:hypothetical protein